MPSATLKRDCIGPQPAGAAQDVRASVSRSVRIVVHLGVQCATCLNLCAGRARLPPSLAQVDGGTVREHWLRPSSTRQCSRTASAARSTRCSRAGSRPRSLTVGLRRMRWLVSVAALGGTRVAEMGRNASTPTELDAWIAEPSDFMLRRGPTSADRENTTERSAVSLDHSDVEEQYPAAGKFVFAWSLKKSA